MEKVTQDIYTKRSKSMIESYEKKFDCSAEDNWTEFLRHIHHKSEGLSTATRRQYRCALRYYLTEVKKVDWDEVVISNFLKSSSTTKEVKKTQGARTSQLKFKSLPEKDWSELLAYLKSSDSQHAELAHGILLASRYFGLRPVEWITAKFGFDDNQCHFYLRVKNAKYAEDSSRSHGEFRTIWFDPIADDKTIDVYYTAMKVMRVLQAVTVDEAKTKITRARNYLSQLYARHSRFKKYKGHKRITLYSARHQFAADLKMGGLPLDEIAALMGHRSDETATRAYGRKRLGKGGIGVQADDQDLERVKAFNVERREEQEFDGGMRM